MVAKPTGSPKPAVGDQRQGTSEPRTEAADLDPYLVPPNGWTPLSEAQNAGKQAVWIVSWTKPAEHTEQVLATERDMQYLVTKLAYQGVTAFSVLIRLTTPVATNEEDDIA